MILYVLDEHGEPRPEPDVLAWGLWFEQARNRVVRQTDIRGVQVSTIFLGIDMSFSPILGVLRLPVLWETMVFGADAYDDIGDLQRRYSSREAALAGHRATVRTVIAAVRAATVKATEDAQ